MLRKYEIPIDSLKDFFYNADTLQRQYKIRGRNKSKYIVRGDAIRKK